MPSRRVWNEGGYEGGSLGEYGLPAMRWTPDLEDRITQAVAQLVRETRPQSDIAIRRSM
jgi:neutral ceramidase